MEIELLGVKELKKVLDKLPQVLADKVYMQALRSGATILRDAARTNAPVAQGFNRQHAFFKHSRSGNKTLLIKLKDEIKITVVTKTPNTYEVNVHTGRAFWGMFFEFGTVKMSARPWFRPAFEATKAEVLGTIGKELGSNLEKQALRLAGSLAHSGLLKGH